MAKKDLGVAETETLVGTGVKLKGNLQSEGDIVIDGELKGSIKTSGNVTFGVNAVVEGNVSGLNVKVAGHLVGNIRAQNETIIEPSAKLSGDVYTSVLSVGHGALFNGRVVMREAHLTPEESVEE